MPKAKIKYPNLRAEMARKNVTIQDIAKAIGTGRDTAGAKLSGKRPLHLDEALTIADALFPGENIKHLFAEEKD